MRVSTRERPRDIVAVDTGYYIHQQGRYGYIYGPDTNAEYYIDEDSDDRHIYGPSRRLPWMK
jgi:hypothetical protein